MKSRLTVQFTLAILLIAGSRLCAQSTQRYAELNKEVERELRAELSHFYPGAVDSSGGFFTTFAADWSRKSEALRTTVSQGRMTWTAAEIARRRPDLKDEYTRYASHGAEYLATVLWDSQYGGFFWAVEPDKKNAFSDMGEKHLYGNAFGLYGVAAAYRVTKNSATLDLAKKAFEWLEQHGHDDKAGGYFEAYYRDGRPMMNAPVKGKKLDQLGTLYGYKSMNAHIHLLEAYTELYKAWPEAKVKSRIIELIGLVADKMYVDPGCLHMQYTRDWRPLPAPDSYGHDIETTFLLDEAEEAISQRSERIAAIGKKLADHSLEYGWDSKNGGLFFEGAAYGNVTDTHKEWWAQAESANTLLLMAQKTGDTTYFSYFERQWKFITDYQIDKVHGGWRQAVSAAGEAPAKGYKAHVWKLAYHNCRAMLNIADRLREMANQPPQAAH